MFLKIVILGLAKDVSSHNESSLKQELLELAKVVTMVSNASVQLRGAARRISVRFAEAAALLGAQNVCRRERRRKTDRIR